MPHTEYVTKESLTYHCDKETSWKSYTDPIIIPLLNFLSLINVPDISTGQQSSWLGVLYYLNSHVVYEVWPEAVKPFTKTTRLNLTEIGSSRKDNVLLSGRAAYEQLVR